MLEEALLPAITAAVRGANSDCPVYNVFPMEDLVSRSTSQRRFVMNLLAAFSGVALLLAAVGVYGIVAQSVALRTPEIGLRMALGAQRSDVLKVVVGQGLKLVLIGVVVGLAAALAFNRILSSMLFGVSTVDPITFAVMPLLLIGVALLASFNPARRATKIDPVIALRSE